MKFIKYINKRFNIIIEGPKYLNCDSPFSNSNKNDWLKYKKQKVKISFNCGL